MPLNDGYVYRERIGSSAGQTALGYLSAKYRQASPAEWAERFARGEVQLDGRPALADEVLRAGQSLSWHRPPWVEGETPQTFDVVFEDDDLVAVVKPSGLPVIPSGGFLQNTLLHLVRVRYPGASPLHRLGRATSGLVLFSRTQPAAAKLSGNWRDGEVEKHYRALSVGVASEDRYEVAAPIGLVPHPRLGLVHGAVTSGGKPSSSTATVLERRPGQTLFAVHIHTGRPEQIRIHLAFIGHPLVGDPMFGAGGLPLADSPGLPGDGGYLLHAETLAFTHPTTGLRMVLRAPPPRELETRDEVRAQASFRALDADR